MNPSGMQGIELTGIGAAIIAGIYFFFKGAVEAIKAWGAIKTKQRDREDQLRREAQERVESEREATHQRVLQELASMTQDVIDVKRELHEANEKHRQCELDLIASRAWLMHMETALIAAGKKAGVDYVPFEQAPRSDSTIVKTPPPQKRSKKGKDDV